MIGFAGIPFLALLLKVDEVPDLRIVNKGSLGPTRGKVKDADKTELHNNARINRISCNAIIF